MKTWFHNQNIIWNSKVNWSGIAREQEESTAFLCHWNLGLVNTLYKKLENWFVGQIVFPL